MLHIGDMVKVIGTTDCGGFEKECIVIGTICKVVGVTITRKGNVVAGIVPVKELPFKGCGEYWYLEKDLEKGKMEWIPEV